MPAEAPDIEGLYREHRAGLVRLVERELRDRHDAEDVVQTAFLDAQRALQRGTIPHNPRAWLAAIALNVARRVRRRDVNVEALEEYAMQQASHLPEIKAALAGLPKSERAAVLYRDLLGLSYAEMAEQMGRTVPGVTMLLHRARLRLRGLLGIALVGDGLWRWLRGNEWDATAANAAGVVALAAGLAVAGVAVGGHVARATAPAARVATATARPRRVFASIRTNVGHHRRHESKVDHSSPAHRARSRANSTSAAPTAAPTAAAAPPPQASATPAAPSTASTTAQDRPEAALPTLSLPVLPSPPPQPPLLPATVAVTTPVATVTVPAPPTATITVPAPVTTVAVRIP